MSDPGTLFAKDEKAQRLLEARAARLRERKQSAEEDGAWVAEFSMGGETYALPLERLVACLPLKGLTPVPQSRRDIVGITRWEGKVVAVFSMALRLGLRGWRRDPNVLLILSSKEGFVGLDCEEIPRSTQLPFGVLAQAPAGGALRPLNLPGGPGQASKLLQLIDPDLLFVAEA
jgi:chemotaxis signal transduction protein